MNFLLRAALPTLLLLLPIQALSESPPEREILAIQSGENTHTFEVEIADTPTSMSQGLMYREELAENHGMLFLYPFPADARMWMKNTLIPLDMVFILPGGAIESMHENAKPHSLEVIQSGQPVAAVLELPGGTVKRLSIKVGDTVLHERLGHETSHSIR